MAPEVLSSIHQVSLWQVNAPDGAVVGSEPVWQTSVEVFNTDTLNIDLPVLTPSLLPGLYAWAIDPISPDTTVHAGNFAIIPSSTGGGGGTELPVLTVNPASVKADFTSQTITINDDADLWTGTESLSVHLYPADQYGYPIAGSDPVEGWFPLGIALTDTSLSVDLYPVPTLLPGPYVFIIQTDEEAPIELGRALFVVEPGTALPPVPLMATPFSAACGTTTSITITEPVGVSNVWNAYDPLALRLVTPAAAPAQSTPVDGFSFNNLTVNDSTITADITIPAAVTAGGYAIEVLAGQNVIGTAPFQVDDSAANEPVQINITPNQLNLGDALSFQFSLSNVTLQNNPYAVAVIPSNSPDVVPTPVTETVALTANENGYLATFGSTIDTAGEYALLIFDGEPSDTNPPPVAAYGLFQVGDVNPGPVNVTITPQSVPLGIAPVLEFTVPANFTMPTPAYGLLIKPGDPITVIGAHMALGVGFNPDTQTNYYTFSNQTPITQAGDYELHIFDEIPVAGSEPIAIGHFTVTEAGLHLVTTELAPATLNQPYRQTI
jgi:hypothetical protein